MAGATYRRATGSVLGLLAVSALHAQVMKCTDPKTGAVSYTNSGCAASETTMQVLRKQTFEEAAQERDQAAIARQRVQREIADIAARRQAEQNERQAAASAYADTRAPDKTSTLDCQKAKRSLEFAQSSVTRPRPQQLAAALVDVETSCSIDASKYMPPPRPVHRPHLPQATMVNCDAAGCWDTNGVRYNRTATGMTDATGRACRRVGTQWFCQ